MPELLNLAVNLSGPVRRVTLYGREHLVAPVRMIVPGVLNGSKGPLYYPPEEISKDYTAWNHMPIVVQHPTKDGQAISARSADVLNTQGIGTVLDARITDGKLDANGYFDVALTRKVAPDILSQLESGKPIELSTGLFTENQPAHNGAHFNGKKYTYIARNYKPDHLAILPGKVGACSIKDGCGVLVNEDEYAGTIIEDDYSELADNSLGSVLAGTALGTATGLSGALGLGMLGMSAGKVLAGIRNLPRVKRVGEKLTKGGVHAKTWLASKMPVLKENKITHLSSLADYKKQVAEGLQADETAEALAEHFEKEGGKFPFAFTHPDSGKHYIFTAESVPEDVLAHEFGHIFDHITLGNKNNPHGPFHSILGKEYAIEKKAWDYSGFEPDKDALGSYKTSRDYERAGLGLGVAAGIASGVQQGTTTAREMDAKQAKANGDNCGTGAGGFKPGNTCAHNELSANCLKGLSYEQLKNELQELLDIVSELAPTDVRDEEPVELVVLDIYDDYVLYTDGQMQFTQGYTNENGIVMLDGEPDVVDDDDEDEEEVEVDQEEEVTENYNPHHDERGRFASAASNKAVKFGKAARKSKDHEVASKYHKEAATAHYRAGKSTSEDKARNYHKSKVSKHVRLSKAHFDASEEIKSKAESRRKIGEAVGESIGGYIGGRTKNKDFIQKLVVKHASSKIGKVAGGKVAESINRLISRKKVEQDMIDNGELEFYLKTLEEELSLTGNVGGPGSGPPPPEGSARWYAMYGTPEQQAYYGPIVAAQRAARKAKKAMGGFHGIPSSGGNIDFTNIKPSGGDSTLRGADKWASLAEAASRKAMASGSTFDQTSAVALHTQAALSNTAESYARAKAAKYHAKQIAFHSSKVKQNVSGWKGNVTDWVKSKPFSKKPAPAPTQDTNEDNFDDVGDDVTDSLGGSSGGNGGNCGTGAGGFQPGNTCAQNEEFVSNETEGESEMALTAQTREKMIKKLVSNCKCGGKDEATLNQETDASLLQLTVNAFCDGADEEDTEGETAAKKKKKEEDMPMMNEEEWLKNAPPAIRSVVENALNFEKTQKEKLITTITANENNIFTKEHLELFNLQQLQGMAALANNNKAKPEAKAAAPLYIGASGGPAINAKADKELAVNEDLDMIPPKVDWSAVSKGKQLV